MESIFSAHGGHRRSACRSAIRFASQAEVDAVIDELDIRGHDFRNRINAVARDLGYEPYSLRVVLDLPNQDLTELLLDAAAFSIGLTLYSESDPQRKLLKVNDGAGSIVIDCEGPYELDIRSQLAVDGFDFGDLLTPLTALHEHRTRKP